MLTDSYCFYLHYGDDSSDSTTPRFTKLDASMPCLASGNVVARDRVLVHLQCFTPDAAAAPIIKILHHLDSGESADHDILHSLELLGNTHAHFSAQRRQKSLNHDLHFASEYLFRSCPLISLALTLPEWQKRGLWLSALQQAKSKPNKPFFEKGRPPYKSQG